MERLHVELGQIGGEGVEYGTEWAESWACSQGQNIYFAGGGVVVADPDPFDTDPDPAFHFDTDPVPAFQSDPDQTV